MEKKFEKLGKEKPRPIGAEKTILSGTKHKIVLGIPLVPRISPIVVQPQTIVVAFQVEDVRIAIGVCFVRYAILATARLIDIVRDASCILFGSITPQARHTK